MLARGLLGVRAIFGDDLAANPRFAAAVTQWLAALFAVGCAATVARVARGHPKQRRTAEQRRR